MAKNVDWLKDCELCNNGVCKRIDQLKDQGMSERAASRQMEKDCDGLWDADKIRDRYRYYKQGHYGGKTPKEGQGFVDQLFRTKERISAILALTNDCAPRCVEGDGGGDACRGRLLNMADSKFNTIYETSALFHSCLRDRKKVYSKKLLRHADVEAIREKHDWYIDE